MSVLTVYEGRFLRLKEDRSNLIRAKEALELTDPGLVGGASGMGDRMVVVLDELVDLKGVWSSLTTVWEALDELRDKPWLSVQPRKVMPRPQGGVAYDMCCSIDQAFPGWADYTNKEFPSSVQNVSIV